MIQWTELVAGIEDFKPIISNVHQFEPLSPRAYYQRVQIQDEPGEELDLDEIRKLPTKEVIVMMEPNRPKLMQVYLDFDPSFAYLIEEVSADEEMKRGRKNGSD